MFQLQNPIKQVYFNMLSVGPRPMPLATKTEKIKNLYAETSEATTDWITNSFDWMVLFLFSSNILELLPGFERQNLLTPLDKL